MEQFSYNDIFKLVKYAILAKGMLTRFGAFNTLFAFLQMAIHVRLSACGAKWKIDGMCGRVNYE